MNEGNGVRAAQGGPIVVDDARVQIPARYHDINGNEIMTQDSDPFDLLPLIKATNRGWMKRSFAACEEVTEKKDEEWIEERSWKKIRSVVDRAEATVRGLCRHNENHMLEQSRYRG